MIKPLLKIAACGLLLFSATQHQLSAQATLISQFDFNGNMSDQQSNSICTSYNNLSSSYSNGEYNWAGDSLANGGGVSIAVPDAVFTETNYSIAIDFRFSDVNSYRKILDFSGLGSDQGLYVNGSLRLYSAGSYGPTMWIADSSYTVVLTRNGTNDSTKVYLLINNQLVSESVAQDVAVNFVATLVGQNRMLEFFHDDTITASEFCPRGSVDQIRIWNGIVTPSDVLAGIAEPTNASPVSVFPVPADASITLAFGRITSGSYAVYSAQGALIERSEFADQTQLQIETTAWAEGAYYVQITGEEFESTVPVIVRR